MIKEILATIGLASTIGTTPLNDYIEPSTQDFYFDSDTGEMEIDGSIIYLDTTSVMTYYKDGGMGISAFNVRLRYNCTFYLNVLSGQRKIRFLGVQCRCTLTTSFMGDEYATQNPVLLSYGFGDTGYPVMVDDLISGSFNMNLILPRTIVYADTSNGFKPYGQIQNPVHTNYVQNVTTTESLPFSNTNDYYRYEYLDDLETVSNYRFQIQDTFDRTTQQCYDAYAWGRDNYSYNNGYQDGYQDGSREGFITGSGVDSAFGALGKVINGFARILNIQVMPGITLGLCLSIPILLVLIVAIFKIARG